MGNGISFVPRGKCVLWVGGGRSAEVRQHRSPPPPPPTPPGGGGRGTVQGGGGATGSRERGKDTSKSTGRSGRQNAATRRNMRREERVTVQRPVKEQQPDGMSHGGSLASPLRSGAGPRAFTCGFDVRYFCGGFDGPVPPACVVAPWQCPRCRGTCFDRDRGAVLTGRPGAGQAVAEPGPVIH